VARPLHSTGNITMRLSVSLAYLTFLLPAIAGADPTPAALPTLAKPQATAPQRTLAASEIAARIRPFDEDIGRCYLGAAGDLRGAGHLDILLDIHRTGVVDRVDVSTPGLSVVASHRVATCVKALVAGTSFPARRSPTIAVLPYFYQHTAAPGSGPQLSCWDPRGCR